MTGISGYAAARAADAMLRTLGGTSVVLLFPAAGIPADAVGGLGLIDPGVEQYSVLRALRAIERADVALLVIDDNGEQRAATADRTGGRSIGVGRAGQPEKCGVGGRVV